MDFEEWEPVYEAIVDAFGFDRTEDERARDVLASLTTPFELQTLECVHNRTVAIAGAGKSLETEPELERARDVDYVFAASTAVDVLESHGVTVDCMVTDLDKNPETVQRLTNRGTPVAVHAHGDNIPAIRSIVPDCADEFVLPTTQAAPRDGVVNPGGFTDGDRTAFLADSLGAGRLEFVGWDFDDTAVTPAKAHKLEWAERLLYWLECRRGDRFDVLDGRREGIDTSAIPVE